MGLGAVGVASGMIPRNLQKAEESEIVTDLWGEKADGACGRGRAASPPQQPSAACRDGWHEPLENTPHEPLANTPLAS